MTEEELLRRLRDAEDGFVERKTSFQARDVREAVVAFADSAPETRPGLVFLGVRPDGTVKGLADPDTLARESVDSACKLQCYPPVRYTTASLTLPEGQVLAVIVPRSAERPHFSGHAFIREGSKTKKASADALAEMIASRNTKAGALIGLKGRELTVRVLGKQIGEPVFESHLDREYNARITECDAHVLTLFLIGYDVTVAEPIEWVTLSSDTKKRRPQLIVQRPG
jgi:hypothetical protein